MDIYEYNSTAWDKEVENGNPWTLTVTAEQVSKAREGVIEILLTPTKFVPSNWLGEIKNKKILCLASGGGQQGPILAASGGLVTVFDGSQSQLNQDAEVAKRENLKLTLLKGDMRDLTQFSDESFDLIVHPVSNCFIPNVLKVWKEAYRVLKKEGRLLSGFNNPISYSWDFELYEKKVLQMKYPIPYSDLTSLTDQERVKFIDKNEPLEFGHTLQDQIGGQTDAGFKVCGFYEDKWGQDRFEDNFYSQFMATLAEK